MGSQIFDYWCGVMTLFLMGNSLTSYRRFDTSGFILEHYIDGDQVNDTNPTERELASPSNLHVWGK